MTRDELTNFLTDRWPHVRWTATPVSICESEPGTNIHMEVDPPMIKRRRWLFFTKMMPDYRAAYRMLPPVMEVHDAIKERFGLEGQGMAFPSELCDEMMAIEASVLGEERAQVG